MLNYNSVLVNRSDRREVKLRVFDGVESLLLQQTRVVRDGEEPAGAERAHREGRFLRVVEAVVVEAAQPAEEADRGGDDDDGGRGEGVAEAELPLVDDVHVLVVFAFEVVGVVVPEGYFST